MRPLSQYINEAFAEEHSKFLTIVFNDSDETGATYDSVVGYIDRDTTLTYYVDINDPVDNTWFRLTSGGKYHDTDKRNWSKKLSTDNIPPKHAEHAAELMRFMDSQLLVKSLNNDSELKAFMSESLLGDVLTSGKDVIDRIVNACTRSPKFLQKLMLILNDSVSSNRSVNESREFIFERSWLAAIATNYLLYLAAQQVAKIDNKWIRMLLLALIAKKVIDTNSLGSKLRSLIS